MVKSSDKYDNTRSSEIKRKREELIRSVVDNKCVVIFNTPHPINPWALRMHTHTQIRLSALFFFFKFTKSIGATDFIISPQMKCVIRKIDSWLWVLHKREKE